MKRLYGTIDVNMNWHANERRGDGGGGIGGIWGGRGEGIGVNDENLASVLGLFQMQWLRKESCRRNLLCRNLEPLSRLLQNRTDVGMRCFQASSAS